jgi:hypothetical protein
MRLCCAHDTFALARPNFHHDMVEDIRHFLLECPAYNAIRTHPRYASIFTMPQPGMHTSVQLRHIFAHPDQRLLADCIYHMWRIRHQLISNSLQWGSTHTLLPQPGSNFPDWWLHGHDDAARPDTF